MEKGEQESFDVFLCKNRGKQGEGDEMKRIERKMKEGNPIIFFASVYNPSLA